MTTKNLMVSQGLTGTEFQWLMIFRWKAFLDLGYPTVCSKFCHTILFAQSSTQYLCHIFGYTYLCILNIYIYFVLDTSLHFCLNNFPWIQFDCKFRAFPFAFVAFRPPLPIGHGLRSLLCGILAEAAKVGDGWVKCHFCYRNSIGAVSCFSKASVQRNDVHELFFYGKEMMFMFLLGR